MIMNLSLLFWSHLSPFARREGDKWGQKRSAFLVNLKPFYKSGYSSKIARWNASFAGVTGCDLKNIFLLEID